MTDWSDFSLKEKIVKTGNPVRQDLLDVSSKSEEAKRLFGLNNAKKTVLVLGGSLGARAINQLIEKELAWFKENEVQLIWQTGKLYISDYQKYNDLDDIQTHAFLNKMDLAYAAADIIISRAGAGSISELCIVGKPVIFIPSPNVAEDHQTKNAMAVVDKGAALIIKETESEKFQTTIEQLMGCPEQRTLLSENIKQLALPNATNDIVNEIEKLMH